MITKSDFIFVRGINVDRTIIRVNKRHLIKIFETAHDNFLMLFTEVQTVECIYEKYCNIV